MPNCQLQTGNWKLVTATPVIIVGASAAGLHAACLLAGAGVPVYVLDERGGPAAAARTLIVTPRLRRALGDLPQEAIVNQTPVLQLFSPGAEASIRLNEPDWVVERARLMPWLIRRARAAGAEYVPGQRFVGLEPDHDGLVVHLESSTGRRESLIAHMLIGADGAFSQVAQAIRQVRPPSSAGAPPQTTRPNAQGHAAVYNLQARVALPAWARVDTTQVWFDPRATRYFFWLIPESRQSAVVGLIADDERSARAELGRFLAAHALQALEMQGGQVPLYAHNGAPEARIAGARVYLVGDAAAHVKVTTVGGLVTGLRGAQAAARAILQRTSYAQELGRLRRELDGHLWIRRVLNCFGPGDFDQLLRLVNGRAQRVLAARTRDEALHALLGALLAQPGFLLLAARAMASRCAGRSLAEEIAPSRRTQDAESAGRQLPRNHPETTHNAEGRGD